jgi:transposase
MGLYAGVDLHARNSYFALVDAAGGRVFTKRVSNDPEVIFRLLHPYKEELTGVVVESTFNWYWLVDGLMDAGFKVHLANPCAIQKYKGLKHADDESEAVWLADMLRLGILPEGYIYPREDRLVRDLLRKRMHLVKLRTSLINSLQNILARNGPVSLGAAKIKQLTEDHVSGLLDWNEDLALSGRVSKETIDYLTGQIRSIERVVEKKVQLKPEYDFLRTMPGVGAILSLTIMLETGPVDRFAKVGNYASYCRKVPVSWTSDGKKKGDANKKNGNKYLAWAFSEAAELARRFDATARAFYNRKASRTNFMIAHSALAHKLARAAYYIMRDQVPFDKEKLFALQLA